MYTLKGNSLDLKLFSKQGPPGNIEVGIFYRGEALAAIALAERHFSGIETQLGKEGDFNIAFQGQVALGMNFDVINHLGFEVVCVKHKDCQADNAANQQQHQYDASYRVAPVVLGMRLCKRNLERAEGRDGNADYSIQAQ